MPGFQGHNAPPPKAAGAPANAVFPPVLKDELPSVHILRYMDGIQKRIQKLQEFWLCQVQPLLILFAKHV